MKICLEPVGKPKTLCIAIENQSDGSANLLQKQSKCEPCKPWKNYD